MRTLWTFLIAWTCILGSAWADHWPQWRGPLGNGTSNEKNLPVRWTANEVAWKAELGGVGVSSPVVWGDRVYVTSQAGKSELRSGNHPTLARGEDAAAERALASRPGEERTEEISFVVEAFRKSDGRRLWQYRVEAEGLQPPVHNKHNLASPSPVTDGEMVFAWFGTGQLVALDTSGKPIWQRNLGTEISPFEISWGHGSSPALYRDLLILLCDHDPASYLLALDKKTGEERWKVDRGKGVRSYSTPVVVSSSAGDELIVNSSERIDAYDPATGKLLWYTGESNRFPIPVASYADGTLYASRGYRSGPYMAIRPGGRGDISGSHIRWRVPTGAPYVSSILFYEGLIYMANDAGIVTCVDGATGEKIWQERTGGIFSASPVGADGKVYMLSETGEVMVLEAGRTFRILSRNVMGERMLASPAISDGRLLIRTDGHLICIGKGRTE